MYVIFGFLVSHEVHILARPVGPLLGPHERRVAEMSSSDYPGTRLLEHDSSPSLGLVDDRTEWNECADACKTGYRASHKNLTEFCSLSYIARACCPCHQGEDGGSRIP